MGSNCSVSTRWMPAEMKRVETMRTCSTSPAVKGAETAEATSRASAKVGRSVKPLKARSTS